PRRTTWPVSRFSPCEFDPSRRPDPTHPVIPVDSREDSKLSPAGAATAGKLAGSAGGHKAEPTISGAAASKTTLRIGATDSKPVHGSVAAPQYTARIDLNTPEQLEL